MTDSGAQLTGKYEKDDTPGEIGDSLLRKRAITLLSDVDKKYVGKTVSRKKMDDDTDSGKHFDLLVVLPLINALISIVTS